MSPARDLGPANGKCRVDTSEDEGQKWVTASWVDSGPGCLIASASPGWLWFRSWNLTGEWHAGEVIANCKPHGDLTFANGEKTDTSELGDIEPLNHKALRRWKTESTAPTVCIGERFEFSYVGNAASSAPDPQSARVRFLTRPKTNGAYGLRSDLSLSFDVV